MTRKEIIEELNGIDAAAVNAILKATARMRHQKRVEQAYEAACKFAGRVYPKARALLWLEARLTTEKSPGWTPPSMRLSPFVNLGKGRRHATDGDAWTAAIATAAMWGIGDPIPLSSVELDARDKYGIPEIVVVVRDNDATKGDYIVPIDELGLCKEDLEEVALFAAREAVRRGNRMLLRAAGLLCQSVLRQMAAEANSAAAG
jgi:hypothetical protein